PFAERRCRGATLDAGRLASAGVELDAVIAGGLKHGADPRMQEVVGIVQKNEVCGLLPRCLGLVSPFVRSELQWRSGPVGGRLVLITHKSPPRRERVRPAMIRFGNMQQEGQPRPRRASSQTYHASVKSKTERKPPSAARIGGQARCR